MNAVRVRAWGAAAIAVASLVSCSSDDAATTQNTAPPLQTIPPDPTQSLTEQARAAGAEHYDVEPEDISVGEPIPLAPSTCVQIGARVREQLEGGGTWFVRLPDGSMIEGDSDEALAIVSRRCFLDDGITPDQDAAADLVLIVGPRWPLSLLGDVKGPRVLGEIGVEWSPPTVTPTVGGFVITLFGQDPFTRSLYEVISTVEGEAATTEFRELP